MNQRTTTEADDAQTKTVRSKTFDLKRKMHSDNEAARDSERHLFAELNRHAPIDLGDVPLEGERIEITYTYKAKGDQYVESGEKTRTGEITRNLTPSGTGGTYLTYRDDDNRTEYHVSGGKIGRSEKPRRRLGTPTEITVQYTESKPDRRESLLELLTGYLDRFDTDADVDEDEKSYKQLELEAVVEHNKGLVESIDSEYLVEITAWESTFTDRKDTRPEAEDLAEAVNKIDGCSATVERREVSD